MRQDSAEAAKAAVRPGPKRTTAGDSTDRSEGSAAGTPCMATCARTAAPSPPPSDYAVITPPAELHQETRPPWLPCMLTGGPAELPARQRVPPRRPAIANSRAMASLAKSCPSRSACSLRNEASTTRPASSKYSTASASAYSSSAAAAWPNQGSALPQSTAVGQRTGCCQQAAFVTCPRRGSEPLRRSSSCPSAAMISAVCLIACGVAHAGVRTSHCDGPTTYRRPHGITYFHGCYSVGDDQLWGVVRRRKGTDHTWAAYGRSARTVRTAPRST